MSRPDFDLLCSFSNASTAMVFVQSLAVCPFSLHAKQTVSECLSLIRLTLRCSDANLRVFASTDYGICMSMYDSRQNKLYSPFRYRLSNFPFFPLSPNLTFFGGRSEGPPPSPSPTPSPSA